jgi:hypothetical protein
MEIVDVRKTQNYKILKEEFLDYWLSNNLSGIPGDEINKAFLAYVKGFRDGINFTTEMDKYLKEHM